MEAFSALLAIWTGNSPVTGEFPAQRLVTRNFDGFFDLRPDKRLSKESWNIYVYPGSQEVLQMIFWYLKPWNAIHSTLDWIPNLESVCHMSPRQISYVQKTGYKCYLDIQSHEI